MTKLSLKRRRLSWLAWGGVLATALFLIYPALLNAVVNAQTFRSDKFTIQSGKQTFFQPVVTTEFTPSNIFLSADFIDYGTLTPTNPIKREINIASEGTGKIFVFQNHPLLARINGANEIIPDTTCDTGGCTESTPSTWVNPFTFGLGFSFDDVTYQQFGGKPAVTIPPSKMTIKLNVNQTQKLGSYTHTMTFWAVPKL